MADASRAKASRTDQLPARGARMAEYYDLDLAGEQSDLEMYLALARSAGGSVLELAAGTGRIAVPLAAAGHDVTAVDFDGHMLERARKRWARARPASGSLETVEAEISSLELGKRFSLVLLALNTLLLLPGREAQQAALSSMARHLAANGRAVLDVWLPAPEDLELYDGRLTLDWLRAADSGEDMVAKLFSARYDPARATAQVVTIFDSWPASGGPLQRTVRRDELWFLSSHELLALAGAAGLAQDVLAGDYGLGPFGTGSERLILLCRLL